MISRRALLTGSAVLLASTMLSSPALALAKNYDQSLAWVLKSEGGYSNDAGDPGGQTMWGITHFDYDEYRRHKGLKRQNVRKMTKAERNEIYRNKYWDNQRCDDLPAGLDYTIFDYGVNSGVGRSGRVLRKVLGLPTNDWHITPAVVAACKEHRAADLVRAVNDERLRFLHGLRTWRRFGGGWGRRVKFVKGQSLALAGVAQASLVGFPHFPHHAPGKAYEEGAPLI